MMILINAEYEVQPNREAEASVIGAMLVSSEIVPEVMALLHDKNFGVPELRTLYKTCISVYLDLGFVDSVALTGALKNDEYRELIARCIQLVPSVHNWQSYACIVLENYKRRCLSEYGVKLAEAAKNEDLKSIQEGLLNAVELFSSDHRNDTWNAQEGFVNFMRQMQYKPDYQQTGIANLDKHLYLESGDFVVVGARPSVGKTALGVQLMLNMAKRYRVGFFSLETSFSKIFGRAIGNYSSTPQDVLKTREDLDFNSLVSFSDSFSELDLYVIESAGWTVGRIKSKAVQLDLDIAIIDYLQKVKGDGHNRYEKVTNISQDLADMARGRKITTIALAQLNREGKGEPTMEDLRESGQIEQDADAIILLHAPERNQDPERKLFIAKNKEGITGRLNFSFDGKLQRFVEQEYKYTSVDLRGDAPW